MLLCYLSHGEKTFLRKKTKKWMKVNLKGKKKKDILILILSGAELIRLWDTESAQN